MNRERWLFGILALACFPTCAATAADATAQQLPSESVAPLRPYDIVLEIGAGAAMRPAYEGAKGYELNPAGSMTLHYLWLPGLGNVKSDRAREGFFIAPSFRYVYERDSADHPELSGLGTVDRAFEIGGKVGYDW